MSHIFISYSRKNQPYARHLADNLIKHGFDVWIDDRIDYGDRWWQTIMEAIEASGAFVVIMSPDAEKSEWVEREILLAQRDNIPIFPLLLDGREFGLLITTQFADVRGEKLPPQDFYDRLEGVIQPGNKAGIYVQPEAPLLPARSSSSGRMIWGAVVGVIVVMALIAGVMALGGGSGDENTPVPTTEIAQQSSDMPTPTETASPTNTPANTPSLTPTPTETASPTSTLTETPLPGFIPVTRNADWTPIEQGFDGVTMVLVPVGCFMMGNDPQAYYDNGTGLVRGIPDGGKQCFDQPFWIDKYEVTNAQFKRLGETTARSSRWTDNNHPREKITWVEACDFCEKRGAHLPTEREWEYAARGPDALIYPWGNKFIAENVVYDGNSGSQTTNVGSRLGGVSWIGALDMSGNVWEWTSTIYDGYSYPYDASDGRENNNDTNSWRVLRGGSWSNTDKSIRTTIRFRLNPNEWNNAFGFRCARSY